MSNLPQPPEGILDPQKPWHLPMPKSVGLWGTLKARLTGRPNEYGNYSSYVNISEAEADTLIANMKKDPRGYPQLDQTSGTPSQWMERQKIYQEWLVEVYLENPFREQVDKKIEEAEIERRLQEIQEQKAKAKQQVKPPQPVVKPSQEEEQDDSDQKELEKQVVEITEELDRESEKEKPKPAEEKQEEQTNKNLDRFSDALQNIKASISSQTAIVTSINSANTGVVSTIGVIQDILTSQTELVRQQQELKKLSEVEASLESGESLASSATSTSTMDDGSAEAEVVKVDGDILTIKPIEGNFKEGQTISAGGKSNGLFDMLKGIAGKFINKGKGGATPSPTKMSKGGIAVGPKKLANGGFQPGIYNKPTVGNLAPGQAVIPMNRNIGKKVLGGSTGEDVKKKHQPLATSMEQPIKAIGSTIVALAGDVIRSLGALAGFFAPYITPLIGSLGKVLGVPMSMIESLLGGPAYAATTDLKQQTNIFADIWSGLMDKFGYIFGGSDKDKKGKGSKKPTTPGKVVQGGDADFWTLSAVASLENGNPEGQADVAQAVYNRVASGVFKVKTIKDAVLSPGQFQPTREGDASLWAAIKDRESAIAAVNSNPNGRGRAEKIVDGAASNITNPSLQKSAAEFVGGRTDFAVPSSANKYPGGFGYVERHGHLFGWYVGPGAIAYGKTNPGPASIPAFPISAEKGANVSQGKAVDAFTLTGPNSGYQVPGIGEMHGKEAVIQYEKGFTVLPIENRLFSMETDPLNTILRWKELLGPSMNSYGKRSFAGGGKVTLYSGHADMTSDSPGGKGTNGGPTGGAPKIPQASGYFTTEAYLNDKIAAMAASKSGGVAEYRAPVRTKLGGDPNSNWTRAKNDVAAGNTPIEIHHDAESGKAGLIASSQSAINKNSYFKSVNNSFGFYRNGDEGFVSRGGAILEMDALKKSIRDNPSSWISSASTKLANALRKSANVEPSDDDTDTNVTASESSQQVPDDPFEAMEKSLKGISVGAGLMEAVRRGEVTDEKSYKAMEERLMRAVDSSAPSPIKEVGIQPAPSQPPAVTVSSSGNKKIISVGNGESRTPVGILEDNVCRLFQ
jgi:hypothetical protein